MKKAIIIFVRNPELGKIKTRLAKDIGEEKTLSVYSYLLKITHDLACNIDADKFVYYADTVITNDSWENDLFIKRVQEGNDLGERMKGAFSSLFQQGYSKVIIIGSDCPELTVFLIEEAYQNLETNEVVIGPAADGGYYLLGMTQLIPELFRNKKWSTAAVFKDTVNDVLHAGKNYFVLPILSDIDTAEDLGRYPQLLNA
jgi:uncharacterized protein